MKYKLKPQIKIILIIIGFILIGILTMHFIKNYNERMEKWYNECDSYYGYKTDYYQCRLYHIGK